tara:strand:- start:550 stop:684 length:135 start_codon:yes stop_codon:yes gene_type:complete
MSKYILWVGGIDDHYDTYEEAYNASFEWHDKGFDDVTIEEVSDE